MPTQGDIGLLDADLARGLLASAEPARLAAAARADGLRSSWVGALDFRTHFPAGLAERGR